MNIEMNYCPQDYQLSYHSSPSRFKIIVGGRRVGKSLAALQEAIAICISKPQSVVWWVSPTLGDAREVGWELFKKQLPEIDCAIQYVNETRMTACFTNNSRLVFKSGEKETSLRGRGLDHLVIDEAAFIQPDIWRRVLRPALTDKRGSATLCSTANGRNWFWEQWNIARENKTFKGRTTWDFFHWPTSMNSLIPAHEIAEAQAELSDIDFRQEYLAEFITRAGMVYSDFSEANEIQQFTIEPKHQIFLSADFGFANPSAICFMAVDPYTERVTQFDEVYAARESISGLANAIEKKLKEWGIGKERVEAIYTDPAGNAEELTSGISPVDYLRMERGYTVINKGTHIAPGLHLVRSFICSAAGERRFFVLNKCPYTIKSIKGYTYAKQPSTDYVKEEPLKDGVHDHACDSVRYFFVNRFDKAKWITKHLSQQDYLRTPAPRGLIMVRCGVCHMKFPWSPNNKGPQVCKGCKEKINADQQPK